MKTILSCTTTYERRNFFYYCIQSLLKQSYKPDLFLLNISREPYLQDRGFGDIPNWLNDKRVKINWVENIGSYRKLIPALDFAGKEDVIITCDDDVLYQEDLIKKLIEAHKHASGSIVCTRARRMETNIFKNWKNYSQWPEISKTTEGMDILPIGIGGVLYKKKLLDLDFLRDDKFLEIAPTTDDLWFRMASLRKGVSVSAFPEIDSYNKPIIHRKGLEQGNVSRTKPANLLSKTAQRVKYFVKDYIGINRTNNDINWDAINKYSK